MKNIRNMQIAVAVIILAMAALVVLVLVVDDPDEETFGSSDGGGAPEFVDALPPVAPGGGTNPIDRPSCERTERISWTEADNYVDQKVAVIGTVSDIDEDGSGATLTVGRTEDETPVTVLITESALSRLPDTPENLFGDDAICVIGVLQDTGDEIRVVVNEPADISAF